MQSCVVVCVACLAVNDRTPTCKIPTDTACAALALASRDKNLKKNIKFTDILCSQKNGKVTHRSIGYDEHADTTELIGYLLTVVRSQYTVHTEHHLLRYFDVVTACS